MDATQTTIRFEVSIPGDDGHVAHRAGEVINAMVALGMRLQARMDGGRIYLVQDHEEPVDSSTVDAKGDGPLTVADLVGKTTDEAAAAFVASGGKADSALRSPYPGERLADSMHTCWKADGNHEWWCKVRPAGADEHLTGRPADAD